MKLAGDDYQRLLALRLGIRQFLHWSELRAEAVGLTAAQHQLLLVVRGSNENPGPAVGSISEALILKHHSAVELIDRAEQAGLVSRKRDSQDHRVVRVTLTPRGKRVLKELTIAHLEELRRRGPALESLLRQAARAEYANGSPTTP